MPRRVLMQLRLLGFVVISFSEIVCLAFGWTNFQHFSGKWQTQMLFFYILLDAWGSTSIWSGTEYTLSIKVDR